MRVITQKRQKNEKMGRGWQQSRSRNITQRAGTAKQLGSISNEKKKKKLLLY